MQIDFCFQLGRRPLNETQPTGMALPVLMPTQVPTHRNWAPAVQHRIACRHLIAGAKKENVTPRGNPVAWYKRCTHPGFFLHGLRRDWYNVWANNKHNTVAQ
jgi:hypothetical protein